MAENKANEKDRAADKADNVRGKGAQHKPLAAYAVGGQVAFSVLIPLLIFFWGGSKLVEALSLPSYVMAIFAVLGVIFMLGTLLSTLYRISVLYDTDKKDKYAGLKHDRRDNDFYDDNVKKKL